MLGDGCRCATPLGTPGSDFDLIVKYLGNDSLSDLRVDHHQVLGIIDLDAAFAVLELQRGSAVFDVGEQFACLFEKPATRQHVRFHLLERTVRLLRPHLFPDLSDGAGVQPLVCQLDLIGDTREHVGPTFVGGIGFRIAIVGFLRIGEIQTFKKVLRHGSLPQVR